MTTPPPTRLLRWPDPDKRLLLAVAAPSEARAVAAGVRHSDEGFAPGPVSGRWELVALTSRIDLVQTGVGKVNAAAAVARTLDVSRHVGVVSLGIGGALPGSGLEIGAVVVAEASLFADEGVLTPSGFRDLWSMGFPLGDYPAGGISASTPWNQMLRSLGPVARVATVSTCSGTDASAAAVVAGTGAAVEAMEGAAVGHVAVRLGVAFAEIRVVSNTTGDRPGQQWDLPGSLRVLSDVAGRL